MRKCPINTILGLQEQETRHIVLRTVRLRKESLKSRKSGEDTEEKARRKNMKKYQTLEKHDKIKPQADGELAENRKVTHRIKGTFCGNIPV